MASEAEVAALALALPEAAPGDDHGAPAFTVRGKIFCALNHGDGRLVVKLDPEDQRNLCEAHPGLLTPAEGYWGRKGWTHLTYGPADAALVEQLLRMSWAGVAPKRLLKL